MSFHLRFETQEGRDEILSWALAGMDLLERIFHMVGQETVDYLKSYTDELRPPVRRGASALSRVQKAVTAANRAARRRLTSVPVGDRPAHPGHWADISHELKNSYGYRVVRTGESIQLIIFNTSGHALYVEAMDGYFVLKGITDADGPLFHKLRAILAQNAPGWRIQ